MAKDKIKPYCDKWPTCECYSCTGCIEARKKVTSKAADHCQEHGNLCHVGCEQR